MPGPVRILAFAGSTREGSFNKKQIRVAAEEARKLGAEVTLIDLREYPLPVYDGDLEKEKGMPENGRKLKELFFTSDALLISTPEYNSSVPGGLKNAIDWISRQEPGEKPLQAFAGKVAALLAASPGALGGLRSLVTLRSILGNIKVFVLPEQFALSRADQAFDEVGALKDEKSLQSVRAVVRSLVDVAAKLKA